MRALAGRLAAAALVALLLLIPLGLIQGLVSERRARRDEALAEVTSRWGAAQTLTGPVLSVPYRVRWRDEKGGEHLRTAWMEILPGRLKVEARAYPETRRRGIFRVVLWAADLEISGSFPAFDQTTLGITADDLIPEHATLSFGVSDARGLRSPSPLAWDGASLPFEPAAASKGLAAAGLHAEVPVAFGTAPHPFSFHLRLQGSDSFALAPAAGETELTLRSAWRDPAFTGGFLPDTRRIDASGFTAGWKVSQFARNVPPRFAAEDPSLDAIRAALSAAAFGVRFYEPVDVYQQTTRALKYAILFIVLTFTVFFLFELLQPVRVHPFSYLLVGCALGLFYLLLLSLSEQAGFGLAYAVSAGAVALLVTAYSAAVLRARRRAALVGALLAALYGYLYVLLRLEDQALLAGSAGLFLALAAVMWLTRNVDWYALGAPKPPRAYPPAGGATSA